MTGAHGDIPAYALFPKDASQMSPALLALHSHDRQYEIGKSGVVGLLGDPAHALGVLAARLGFVVLAPDLPGFEENRPSLAERKKNFALQGEHYERQLAMNALLWGATLQGRIASDLSACVSALAADRRVAQHRIFAAGHSFGGQEAMWTTRLDKRIAGCLSSCGFSLARLIAERHIPHNMALYVPGLLPDLDFDAVGAALVSRPFYAIAAEEDAIYPVDGVRMVEAQVVRKRSVTNNYRFLYTPDPHAFSPDHITDGLRWLLSSPRGKRPGRL